MRKKFTILTAALALLAMLAVPKGGWGQATTYTSNVTLPTSGTNVSSCNVVISNETYSATKLGKSGSGASANVTIPSGTTTLYVHCAAWNGKSSTLTLSTTANGVTISPSTAWSLTSDSGIAGNSSSFTLDDPDKASTDYFQEYTLTGVNSDIQVSFTAGTERAVFWGVNAVAGPTTYSVTYNGNGSDGGTAVVDPNSPYQPNATVTVLANTFTKTGNTFFCWSDTPDGTGNLYDPDDNNSNTFPITQNTTLYAQWSLNQYNVAIEEVDNVDLYADMLGEGEDDDIDYGTEITLSYDNLSSGYAFSSWVITKNEDGSNVTSQVLNGSTLTVPDYNITISATLIQVYTVNFNLNNGTFVANTDFPSDIVEKPAGTYTLPSATRSGYSFTGWAAGGTTYSAGASYTVSDDVTFDAQWEESNEIVDELTAAWTGVTTNTYTSWSNKSVTNGSGAVYAGKTNYNNGGIGLRTKNSEEGIITTTSGGLVRKVAVTWQSTTANRTIQVYGKNTPYEAVTDLFDNDKKGTLLGSIVYNSSTEITVSRDYAYVGIRSASDALAVDPISITWEVETQYTITCDHTGTDGTIAADPTEATAGTLITLTATPAEHYHLVSWEVIGDEDVVETNPTGVNTATFEMPASNVIVDATFAPDTQYDITIPAEIENNVIVDVTNNKAYAGETVTITVEAPTGKVLNTLTVTDDANNTNVEISPEVSTAVSDYTFMMPASNVSIAATFRDAVSYTLTVTLGDHIAAIFVYDNPNGDPLITDGAAGNVSVLEGTEILVSPDVASGYVLESLTVDGVNVTTQLDASGAYTFTMPSHAVTITATASEYVAPVVGKYVRITDLTKLTDGCKLIIAARYDEEVTDGYYAMTGTTSGKPTGIAFTSELSDDNEILPTAIADDEDDYYWIVNITENGYTFTNASGNKIGCGSSTDFSSTSNFYWNVTRGESDSDAMVGDYTGFVITTKSNNDRAFALNESHNFGAYATSNMTGNNAYKYNFYLDFFIYTETHTKNIAGNKWYFIASPVGAAPTNVNALTDLYYYDEQEHYWRNKKNTDNADGFDFAIGKGYLCANADPTLQNTPATVALTFTGTPVFGSTYNVPVTYNETTSGGDDNTLAGWNLVGNPFGSAATIAIPCYTLRGAMNMASVTAGTTISACEAVMVQASSEGQVTFTKATAGETPQPNQLQLTVAQQVVTRSGMNSQVNDNAIINFNAGSQLEKFAFNADAAKLYIPQNGKDFAIVSAEGQGEMPVNFRAAKNGTYTLTVNPEGVEMNYLHLIDNMTGNDVDLLATPNYTFNATTRDYESRFRLVFAANNENGVSAGSTTFAYFSNGNLVVNNEGNATLQVVDVMGRIVKSESINGSASINVNAAPGVYMLRLINGNDVRTQKIVVR